MGRIKKATAVKAATTLKKYAIQEGGRGIASVDKLAGKLVKQSKPVVKKTKKFVTKTYKDAAKEVSEWFKTKKK